MGWLDEIPELPQEFGCVVQGRGADGVWRRGVVTQGEVQGLVEVLVGGSSLPWLYEPASLRSDLTHPNGFAWACGQLGMDGFAKMRVLRELPLYDGGKCLFWVAERLVGLTPIIDADRLLIARALTNSR